MQGGTKELERWESGNANYLLDGDFRTREQMILIQTGEDWADDSGDELLPY